MMRIEPAWLLFVCLVTPAFCAIGVFYVWRWRMRKVAGRQPVSEKLLRPAGESSRLVIDKLSENLGESIALALAVPGVLMAVIVFTSSDGRASRERVAAAFVICGAVLVPLLWRVLRIGAKLRDYRLGFHGERATGEELNQLMLQGCRVFHDVPMDPYGNIDHVIVSSAGVFAVETKTRRKRPAPKGRRDCDAVFDGEAVEFPTWRETEMVTQARMQGDRLRSFLAKAVGEPVAVLPILTLPGWFVTTRARPDGIRVLHPRQIASVAADKAREKLTPQMVQRIAYQLEQKCRDVEL